VPPVRVRLIAAKTGLKRHRKLCLARPQGSDSTSTSDERTPPRPTPGLGLNLDLGRRSPPRPTLGLGLSLDSRRRSPPHPTPGLGLSLDSGRRSPPRPTPGLGLSLDLGGVTALPTSGSDRPRHRGAIITLPLASSGYGEQDLRPIWLVPIKQVMMAPRVLHDDGGSQPPTEARRRQQGSDSPDSCAPTGLKHSSDGHDIT
jgi:hypothetical protein